MIKCLIPWWKFDVFWNSPQRVVRPSSGRKDEKWWKMSYLSTFQYRYCTYKQNETSVEISIKFTAMKWQTNWNPTSVRRTVLSIWSRIWFSFCFWSCSSLSWGKIILFLLQKDLTNMYESLTWQKSEKYLHKPFVLFHSELTKASPVCSTVSIIK